MYEYPKKECVPVPRILVFLFPVSCLTIQLRIPYSTHLIVVSFLSAVDPSTQAPIPQDLPSYVLLHLQYSG